MILDKFPLMVSKLRLVFTTTIVFLSFSGYGQNTFWRQETSQNEVDRVFSEQYDIDKGKVFAFEEADFKRSLQTMSFAKGNSKVVYFPDFAILIYFCNSFPGYLSP